MGFFLNPSETRRWLNRETLWRKWWIASCLLYWRVKHPLLSGSNNWKQDYEMQLEQLEGSQMKSLMVVHVTTASSLAYCSMSNLGWKLALYPAPQTRHDDMAAWHPCPVPCGGSQFTSWDTWKSSQLQSLLRSGEQAVSEPPPCVFIPCITDRNWNAFGFPLNLARWDFSAREDGQMAKRNISFIKIVTHSCALSRSSVAPSLSILMRFWKREKPLQPLVGGMERRTTGRIKDQEDAQVNCCLSNWRDIAIKQSSQLHFL